MLEAGAVKGMVQIVSPKLFELCVFVVIIGISLEVVVLRNDLLIKSHSRSGKNFMFELGV